jgi:hypothetical protein
MVATPHEHAGPDHALGAILISGTGGQLHEGFWIEDDGILVECGRFTVREICVWWDDTVEVLATCLEGGFKPLCDCTSF